MIITLSREWSGPYTVTEPEVLQSLDGAVMVWFGASAPASHVGLVVDGRLALTIGQVFWARATDASVTARFDRSAGGAPSATVPGIFGASQWTLADSPSAGGNTLTLTITALPSDGGSSITGLQFRRNGGAPTTLSGTGTGARSITVLATTAANIEVRAVNAVGDGPWSDIKTATPTVTGGYTLLALPVTPTVRFHPHFSPVTKTGSRVTAATDLMGLANATGAGTFGGPEEGTDRLGRKFWRFDGYRYMDVQNTLTGQDNRAYAVFVVGRSFRNSHAIWGIGNVANGTAIDNTAGAALDVFGLANGVGFVRGFGRAGYSAASGKEYLVPGTQLQVMGMTSRTTANGGTRVYVNERSGDVGQNTVARAGQVGAEIGRYPFSPGAAGTWANCEIYDLIVYNRALTNAEADSIVAALVAHYADIVPITSQLVMKGDSITQGTVQGGDPNHPNMVNGHFATAAVLGEPGRGLIPPGWRVINTGVSGSVVAGLVSRRDDVNSWSNQMLPGQNVCSVQIGVNDLGTTGGFQAPATVYSNLVAYLNTATTGVLQKGWTVRQQINIGAGISAPMVTYRGLLRDPQFLIDTGANVGGPFAGKLSIVESVLIEIGGVQIWNPVPIAGVMQSDNLHPAPLGAEAIATGGSTPQYGLAFGLV